MYFICIVIVRVTALKMNFCVHNIAILYIIYYMYIDFIYMEIMYMIAYDVYCLYIFRAFIYTIHSIVTVSKIN